MDLILRLSMEKGAMSESDVMDEVNTLIITGYDTVAVTLCYTLMALGSYPEVQDRVYKEIKEVFSDETDRDVEKTDLSKLVYMEALIKEVLRVYPTIPIVGRNAPFEIQLKMYTLKAGSTFTVIVPGLHSDASWGDNVDQFKPERWLSPDTLPENPNTFAVFGIGRRSCIELCDDVNEDNAFSSTEAIQNNFRYNSTGIENGSFAEAFIRTTH